MKKYILLDIAKCSVCKSRVCQCSYPYHSYNRGPDALAESLIFNNLCKQCEEPPCVRSCTKDALEKAPRVNIKRHNARCIDCNSCVLACPFGVLTRQATAYLASKCDLCAGRLLPEEKPICVLTCPHGALEYTETEKNPSTPEI